MGRHRKPNRLEIDRVNENISLQHEKIDCVERCVDVTCICARSRVSLTARPVVCFCYGQPRFARKWAKTPFLRSPAACRSDGRTEALS